MGPLDLQNDDVGQIDPLFRKTAAEQPLKNLFAMAPVIISEKRDLLWSNQPTIKETHPVLLLKFPNRKASL